MIQWPRRYAGALLAIEVVAVLLAWAWLAPSLAQRLPVSVPRFRLWAQLAVTLLPPLAWILWRLSRQLREQLERGGRRLGPPEAWALACLLPGLVLTAWVADWVADEQYSQARFRFNYQAELLQRELQARLERPLLALRALRAMYAANDRFTRLEFTRFVGSRDLAAEFPGVRGLGFIEHVRRENLENFIRRERADDAPSFEVRTSGDAPDLYIIKYIEPLMPNRLAWGLDIGVESVRRAAVEAALRSGQPALSGLISLAQGGQGMLLLLPVHDAESLLETEAQRRAATVGFVYAPIAVEPLLADIEATTGGLIDFELADVDGTGRPRAFRNPRGDPTALLQRLGDGDSQRSAHMSERGILVGGRPIALYVWSTPAFDQSTDAATPLRLALMGTLLSVLLSLVVWLMFTGRQRAAQLALRMTQELREASRATAAAQRENEFLLNTMDQHCIVSMTDPQGHISYANPAFVEVSGYPQAELQGQSQSIVNSGSHSPAFWADFWAALRAGQVWKGEICNRTKEGRHYWVKSTVVPFLDEQGQVDRYVAVSTDVSAEHLIREELQTTNQRFAIALEGGSDGLWDWIDTHSQQMWWSPQMYRQLGYEPGELVSSIDVFDSLLHPEDQARTLEALSEALKGTRNYDVEFRLCTRSGVYRWFHSRAKVFRNAAGEHQRMAGSLQDIDELKQTQAHLRTRNAQMSAVFAVSPDAFVAFDRAFVANFVSPALTRLTGLDIEPLQGLSLEPLLDTLGTHGSFGAAETFVQRMADLHGDGLVLEIQHGRRRTLSLHLHGADAESDISELLHVRDITQQMEVEQMKSDFLSTAAHELRTPMASIYGFTELMMTREMPEERRQQFLAKIYRQSKAMMTILNELLDLARIEARGGKDFDIQTQDLADLVREAAQDFQPPNDRPGPQLSIEVQPAWVRVDRDKLLQTLRNLLSNAYKYSPQGGDVGLRLGADGTGGGDWLRLEVQDHGIGMTAEQLAHVTERFYRADASGAIPGTGLGMSIVKEIIELHGGRLSLSSVPGEGTCVHLLLPRATAPSPAVAASDVESAA